VSIYKDWLGWHCLDSAQFQAFSNFMLGIAEEIDKGTLASPGNTYNSGKQNTTKVKSDEATSIILMNVRYKNWFVALDSISMAGHSASSKIWVMGWQPGRLSDGCNMFCPACPQMDINIPPETEWKPDDR
jgi:hypothetical protein